MITEHALLPVTPGQEDDFESAFAVARPIIARAKGCRSVSLSRSIESPSSYLLLVEWESVEDHMVGFRESEDFQEWRSLLHHFYATPAVVEHFVVVSSTSN